MTRRFQHVLTRQAPAAGWAVLLVLLAMLVARAPLTGLVPALAGLALALLVLLRPVWGLLVLAAAIPFATVGEQSLFGAQIGSAEALLGWTLCSWLAMRLASGRLVLPAPWRTARTPATVPVAPLYLPLVLVTAAATLSLLRATSLGDAVPELLKWVEMLALYLMAVDLLWTPAAARRTDVTRPARWLVAAILIGASVQAALGLYQFVFQAGPPAFQILGRFLRAYGTFRQPNPYAGYLGLVLPLALSVFYWALGRWRRTMWPAPGAGVTRGQRRAAWAAVLVGGAAVGLITAGAIASWSRGAWLGILAGVLVVTILRSRRTFLLSLAVAGILALALFLRGGLSTGAVGARLIDMQQYLGGFDVRTVEVNDDNFAVVERVAHWDAAWQMIEQSPWLGIGTGNYAVVYPQVALPRWEDPLGHAHNIYLHTWAETGLPGLLSYLLLWLVAIWQAWRVGHDRRLSAWQRAAALGVLGIIVHLSVHNLFDNLLVQRMYLHLALVLALLTVPPRPAQDDASISQFHTPL